MGQRPVFRVPKGTHENSPPIHRWESATHFASPVGTAETRSLVPDIAFIVFNSVFFQERQQFFLKRLPTMVFFLVLNLTQS
jgi:hypothetical protein